MSVRPLSDEDQAILAVESDRIAGHTCKVLRLDACPDGTAVTAEALRSQIAVRIGDAPELRWVLGEEHGRAVWIDTGVPDLEHHVRAIPGPLTDAELGAHAARLMGTRLGRDRPLWSIDVVERLETGGSALVWRIHHALADGSTAMRLGRAVLWDEALESMSSSRREAPSTRHPPAPEPHPKVVAALRHELTPSIGHKTALAGRVGTERAVATATVDLAAVKAIAHAREPHATVNDVVLAACAGGLRRWLLHHHAGPLPAVRVRVPVSLHQPGEDAGNRDSFFAVDLHLNEPSAAARLDAIHADTNRRKHDRDAVALDGLLHGIGHRAPALARLVRAWEDSARAFALSVSNVPGPRGVVSVLGAPARALHSVVEVGDHHLLRVAVISMGGTLGFGLCADADAVQDLDVLAEGIEAELTELAAAVRY